MCLIRNQMYCQRYRGFESLPLRQVPMLPEGRHFLFPASRARSCEAGNKKCRAHSAQHWDLDRLPRQGSAQLLPRTPIPRRTQSKLARAKRETKNAERAARSIGTWTASPRQGSAQLLPRTPSLEEHNRSSLVRSGKQKMPSAQHWDLDRLPPPGISAATPWLIYVTLIFCSGATRC